MVADAVLRQRNAAESLVNLVTAVSALVIGPETSLVPLLGAGLVACGDLA
jgi:hypothetical protein